MFEPWSPNAVSRKSTTAAALATTTPVTRSNKSPSATSAATAKHLLSPDPWMWWPPPAAAASPGSAAPLATPKSIVSKRRTLLASPSLSSKNLVTMSGRIDLKRKSIARTPNAAQPLPPSTSKLGENASENKATISNGHFWNRTLKRFKSSETSTDATVAKTGSITTVKKPSPASCIQYKDALEGVWGCSHYATKALLSAPCCDKFYACRFCHDEKEKHTLVRNQVNRVQCMKCSTIQSWRTSCESCGESFASYSCEDCKFLDNDSSKRIYHCADCGVCRAGDAADYFHCHTCRACLHVSLKDKHKCIERCLESSCPICMDEMATSTLPIVILERCGHAIHDGCLAEHLKRAATCPVCCKSVGDNSDFVARVDKVMQSSEMPAEWAHFSAEIYCVDCEQDSMAKLHLRYHKCGECGSYNTRVKERVRNTGSTT